MSGCCNRTCSTSRGATLTPPVLIISFSGASRVAFAFLVYMLPPLPRCSSWAYSSLISPSRVSLPRKGHRVGLHIDLFEACSAFTHVAACTLARSPYFVTRYPKASDILSPPCLLRLLPAGAVAGWGLHPLESAALSRRTPEAVLHDLTGRWWSWLRKRTFSR